MLTLLSALGLSAALALFPSTGRPVDDPFPASTALAEGVSPAALGRLDELVQSLVDDEEIVGAELLVIKNGRSILHEAYGWRDREAELPMNTGSVFCVRSMTKPLIGTAILMLIDDDMLELDDRVAKFLPAFDVEGARDITVEHLLTHTSGLPMSLILDMDWEAVPDIQAVAALGARQPLGFTPGSALSYSDQGTDTLTALIEAVTGAPAVDFVRARILEPLGMEDSACVMTEGHPLRARGCGNYAGSRGAWTRFWGPEQPPLFPFFLGSQGLYSTLEDYGRFMEFWRNKGRRGKERLLASRYVRKALTPSPFPLGAPTGFPGALASYGFLMQLWTAPGAGEEGSDEGERELLAFGHTGSDGTHAWVFPKQNAMALYFTQSRNNSTGLRVEEVLSELFLGAAFDPNQAAPPFEEYLGYYWEGEGDLYRAIIRDGDDLALEIMGQGVVPLTYAGEDRWKFRPNPSVVLAFDRSAEGVVTGYHIDDHQEFRFAPSATLPTVEEIVARVAEHHRLDLVEAMGPIRMRGTMVIEALGVTAERTTLLAAPDRFRIDVVNGEEFEGVAFDGDRMRYASSKEPAHLLEGPHADSARLDSPFSRFGDLPRWYPRLQVIQRLARGGRDLVLLRTGDTSGPARTLYVDAETGLVVCEEGMAYIETLGRIGRRMTFRDFRDVGGMTLPFETKIELANPLIGTIVLRVEEVELGVELPAGYFALRD